jgi:hypothetical protein
MRPRLASLALLAALLPNLAACGARSAPSGAPLVLERTIPLTAGSGRIDHLALDPTRRRLFVAELGAGAVEAVDLATGKAVGRIGGLKEPQGIGFVADRDELVVASGGDGSVRFYRGADLSPLGTVELGGDADNVRVDARGRVVVGYGSGALAVIEPKTRQIVRKIALPAHPEGFQLDGRRGFVNAPNAGGISVVDIETGQRVATWPNPRLHFNFPMAIAPTSHLIAAVYRLPARLVLFETGSGGVRQTLGACGDADDVWFDGRRRRIYVICGGGSVDVFEARGGGEYARTARIATRRGARRGLFSPQLDRLYVAVRADGGQPPAIWAFRPQ